MKIVLFILCCWLCGVFDLVEAENAQVVHVTLGKVSEIVLPEKVAKVIKGGEVDSVLVEVLESSVYILPKTNKPADLFITGVSGKSYPINLVMGKEHDVQVDLQQHNKVTPGYQGKMEPLDLMRVLLRQEEPIGATLLHVNPKINLNDNEINLQVLKVYDYPQMVAYIIKAVNPSLNSVVVPIEQISFPNILAIASGQDLLMPHGEESDSTNIYMVVGK